MHVNHPAKDSVKLREGGFTMVEVAVGVTVMALLFLSLYAGITYGFYETQLARENLRATQVIVEKMEGIRLYTYYQLTNSTTFSRNFTEQYYALSGNNGSPGVTFYGQISIGSADDTVGYSSDLRLVQITVTWTNNYGPNSVVRTREMKTLVAQYGIQNYTFFN